MGDIRSNLRALRNQAGVSQAELARLADTSERNIQQWQKGISGINLKNLLKLSHALGCDVYDIFTEVDDEGQELPPERGGYEELLELTSEILIDLAQRNPDPARTREILAWRYRLSDLQGEAFKQS